MLNRQSAETNHIAPALRRAIPPETTDESTVLDRQILLAPETWSDTSEDAGVDSTSVTGSVVSNVTSQAPSVANSLANSVTTSIAPSLAKSIPQVKVEKALRYYNSRSLTTLKLTALEDPRAELEAGASPEAMELLPLLQRVYLQGAESDTQLVGALQYFGSQVSYTQDLAQDSHADERKFTAEGAASSP